LSSYHTAYSFVPSLQFNYNPSYFINGKFTFKVGTTFYFNESYSFSGFDPNGVNQWTSYSPAKIYNSFNTGVMYNVLKKNSKLSLNLGFDAVIAFRELRENHISYPVIPWPTIQYGMKF
jgi:hypothetical protein